MEGRGESTRWTEIRAPVGDSVPWGTGVGWTPIGYLNGTPRITGVIRGQFIQQEATPSRRRDYVQRDTWLDGKSAIPISEGDRKSCSCPVGAGKVNMAVLVKIRRQG